MIGAVLAAATGGPVLAEGPVIPEFGGTACRQTFCWSWVQDNWSATLAPRIVEHVYITLIALAAGLVITMVAALIAYRLRWFEKVFDAFSTILYTIPTLAFIYLIVAFTGIGLLTMELALVGYTFLLLFRNILTGLRSTPPAAIAAATGMGMTRNETLFKVTVPLAVPSIMAGLRIASVTTIALAAVASLLVPIGLGSPIADALRTGFQTELITASVLTILLALIGDLILVGVTRLITPWARARGKG